MHPKLARLRNTLSEIVRGMTADDLTRHPDGKWSAAEILEHLNLTYTGTVRNLERCLAAGKPGASSDRRKMRWQRFAITRLGLFPRGRKAPERVLPRGMPPQQVVAETLQNLERMDGVIRDCELRFERGKPVADHPILGPLTACEWRAFHSAHGRHHARQIIRLRKRFTR